MNAHCTDDMERSLASLVALATDLERRLDNGARDRLDVAVGDFVRRARGHLDLERRSQERVPASSSPGMSSPPGWWRYAYLRRVLDDVMVAAQDPDGNPTALRRLLRIWASDPLAGRRIAELEPQT